MKVNEWKREKERKENEWKREKERKENKWKREKERKEKVISIKINYIEMIIIHSGASAPWIWYSIFVMQ